VKDFPGYAQIRRVALLTEKRTVDDGLLTPTLKLRRAPIFERHGARVAAMYRGSLP